MKVTILTFLMVVTLVAARSESIQDDLRDLMELIPMEKIIQIAAQHLQDDPNFQAAVGYMKSPEWKNIIDEFVAQPEVQQLQQFLKEAGLDFDILGSNMTLCKFIMDAKVPASDFQARNLSNFLYDVQDIIPMISLIAMLDDKLNNSPYFEEFYNKITSDDAYLLVESIRALAPSKNLTDELAIMGIDVNRILSVMYTLFGWNRKEKS